MVQKNNNIGMIERGSQSNKGTLSFHRNEPFFEPDTVYQILSSDPPLGEVPSSEK